MAANFSQSLVANVTIERNLEKVLKEIDEKLQRYLQQLDINDATPPLLLALTPEQLQAEIEAFKQRQTKYEQLQTQLVESGERQLSLTDPDSRSLPMGGTRHGRGVQRAKCG